MKVRALAIKEFFLGFFFFFNDTATTEIYTLSLHDALPICVVVLSRDAGVGQTAITTCAMAVSQHFLAWQCGERIEPDRKSTRLNSSHGYISYAVFCLKKKKDIAILHARVFLLTYEIEPNSI